MLIQFKLQERRLISWAKHVQMDYTDEHLTFNHMSRPLIIDVMEQQRSLLFKFRELKEKKKLDRFAKPLRTQTAIQSPSTNPLLQNGSAATNGNAITNGETEGSPENKTVQFPSTEVEEIVRKAWKYLKKIQEVPKQLKWAAFHSDKFGELIEKLTSLNTAMLEALGQGQMEVLMGMHKRTDYQILVMNHRLEQVAQILQSQLLTSSRHHNRITELDESEYDELDSQVIPRVRRLSLGALAHSKARNQVMEGSTIDPSLARHLGLPEPNKTNAIRDEAELSIKDIFTRDGRPLSELDDEDDDSKRTEAYYNDTSVWIEWKILDQNPHVQDSNVDVKTEDKAKAELKVEERIKNLASLLKSNSNADEDNDPYQFRAPHCLGYFFDEEYQRYGLVFKKPKRASTEPPVTLHSLLTATDANGDLDVPSLTDRIKLMRLLSETIERLHAVDWLHKGLRSANILFFKESNNIIDFTNPYISGFEYSRPAKRDDMTERPSDDLASDIYRHPFVQMANNRGGFKKSHDLYSLGILLLEIAYWKPLDQILSIDLERARPKDAYKVKDRLLSERVWLRNVKSNQGNTVEDIIRTCLEGPEAFLDDKYDKDSAHAEVELQRAFGEKVVERLEQMKGL